MKKYRLILLSILSLMVLCLSACGPMYSTSYEYVPPHTQMGQMCTMQCQQTKSMCQQMCSMQQQNCEMRAHDDARHAYHEYKRDREHDGKQVKKDVNDFDNSGSCSQSCGCNENFDGCYTACGGQIIPHRQCVAFCNSQPMM